MTGHHNRNDKPCLCDWNPENGYRLSVDCPRHDWNEDTEESAKLHQSWPGIEAMIEQQLDPFGEDSRQAMWAAAAALSFWVQHSSGCARLESTGNYCNCGLGITLQRWKP